MKKGSFAGLLYREYYLGRNSYITGLLFSVIQALIGWLALLSLKHGNLGLLLGDISDSDGGIIKNKEVSDILRLFVVMTIKYMPSVMASMIAVSPTDAACKDIMNIWNRFEHCTPVTPLRYAAVKTVSTAIPTVVSFFIAVIYIFTITSALGDGFTYGDFSVIVILIALFIVCMSILPQIFVTLLRSRDKGWLCTIGVLMVTIFIASFINANKTDEMPSTDENMDIVTTISELANKAQVYCPVALAVLVIGFAVMFVSMYLLYKRREK